MADDTEYVEAIKEAKEWGSGNFLRRLFVIVLMSNSINKPEDVWKKTWEWFFDEILYNERIILKKSR